MALKIDSLVSIELASDSAMVAGDLADVVEVDVKP